MDEQDINLEQEVKIACKSFLRDTLNAHFTLKAFTVNPETRMVDIFYRVTRIGTGHTHITRDCIHLEELTEEYMMDGIDEDDITEAWANETDADPVQDIKEFQKHFDRIHGTLKDGIPLNKKRVQQGINEGWIEVKDNGDKVLNLKDHSGFDDELVVQIYDGEKVYGVETNIEDTSFGGNDE